MFYKLGKKIFYILIQLLKSIQISLVILSFLTVLYWILDVAQVKFAESIVQFFNFIKDFVHIFYNRTVKIDQISVDFSFLIAVFIFIAIAWLMNYLAEGLEFIEKKYDKIHFFLKNKNEEAFNIKLDRNHQAMEKKLDKFLLMINFSVKDLSQESFYTREVKMNDSEREKEVVISLWEVISEKIKIKETFFGANLMLQFDNFKQIDETLQLIENSIKEVKTEYKERKWRLSHFIALDVYSKEEEVIIKARKLKTLLNLNFENSVVCFATFKEKYALTNKPIYSVNTEGVYKIGETEEEVFGVKKMS